MAGKQHFAVLDGLQGVAAIAVTICHGTFVLGGKPPLPEAYLAVDFFFLLSGVVLLALMKIDSKPARRSITLLSAQSAYIL